jgi:hypothetical protein
MTLCCAQQVREATYAMMFTGVVITLNTLADLQLLLELGHVKMNE